MVGPLTYDPPSVDLSVKAVPLSNANFETGDLSAWSNTGANVVSSKDEVFSGFSAQMQGSAGSIMQTVDVQTNTNYTLSAFVSGKGKLSAQIGSDLVESDSDSSSFRFQSVSFNSGTHTNVDIIAQVDDLVTNSVHIENPNFDDDQNAWVVNEGTGIGQVQDSDNSSSSTNGSIKFTHNDADNGTPYQPYIAQTLIVEPNTEYTLTMYILLKSSDAQDASVLFGVHTGDAVQGGIFDSAAVVASKNSIYGNLPDDDEAEDSFRTG